MTKAKRRHQVLIRLDEQEAAAVRAMADRFARTEADTVRVIILAVARELGHVPLVRPQEVGHEQSERAAA